MVRGRRIGCLVVFLCVWLAVPGVGAQVASIGDLSIPGSYPRVVVGLSVGAGLTLGTRCPTPTGDAVGCPLETPVVELRLTPRWQATGNWAIGLSEAYLFVPNFMGQSTTTWWDLQAEARYYPSGQGYSGSWIGAAGGLVVARDSAPATQTYTNLAPSVSLGVGLDSEVRGWLAAGPEVRAVFFGLSTGQQSGGPLYGPQFGLLLGFTVTGSGFRR